MVGAQKPVRLNNIGALRLFLAYAVIVSHSPEMLDGNRSRELLVNMGSHVTLGGLAVDGFFILSGYLIAASFLSSRSLLTFLRSRILRIYPAFLVAFLVCLLLVGPAAGGDLHSIGFSGALSAIGRALLLEEPRLPGAFHSLPIPSLDGSMWTIRYEFRCYLAVAMLGALGLLERRRLVLGITILCYAVNAAFIFIGGPMIRSGLAHQIVFGVIGDPPILSALLAVFFTGVCSYLYRDRIVFNHLTLILLLAALFGAVLKLPYLEPVVGIAGCYILLWLGFGLSSERLQRLNNRYDFSYGIYLYAWPIAALIILIAQRQHLAMPPALLTGLTAVVSTVVGAISWYVVERPSLSLKSRRSKSKPVALA